jgi:acyl-coenzyme A synthetase/AMP-(fatty) acid ligase
MMQADITTALAIRECSETLAASDSELHLNGQTATVAALLQRGQQHWHSQPSHQFPALAGIEQIDMLSMLLAALVHRYPALLCANGAQSPASCDAHISATVEDGVVFASRRQPVQTIATPSNTAAWPDGLAVMSSGTLGAPKLIWHRHRDLAATGTLVMRRLKLSANDRVLITVPLHHLYGLGAALIPALLASARVCLLPKANLINFNDALRRFAPTLVFSTPHLLRGLLQRKNQPLNGCRGVVLAGDGTPSSLHAQAERVFNRVFDLYGSSELGVVAISEPDLSQVLRPLESVRVFAADRHAEKSNLIVAHPHAATHIAQHETLFPMPREWDTRDIAVFAGNGGFNIQGRADLSVNRAGKLLVLADLERTIMGWPGVDLAVAITLEDESSAAGTAIAVVVQASNTHLSVDGLKQLASTTLPAFARPDRFSLVSQLPRLGSGKPDRNAITQEYRHG